MRILAHSRIVPVGFVLAILVFIFVSVLSLINVRQLGQTHQQSEHIHEIITQLGIIDNQIRIAENSKRGYLITGQPKHLALYFDAKQQLASALNRLSTLTADNPGVQAQLSNDLTPLIQARLDLIEQVIDTRDRDSFEAAVEIVEEGPGEQLMGEILDLLQRMHNDQDHALEKLLEQTTNQTQVTLLAISSSIILGLVILLSSLYRLRLEAKRRNQLTEALRLQTGELEQRNQELDAFAQMVAHDLKNPVGVMVGIADILIRDHHTMPNDDLLEYLSTITRSGHKANGIIEALLLLAGLRKTEIQLKPLQMAEIIAEVRQDLAEIIDTYRGELIIPSKWPVALGYSPWVEQVWVNYISNGLKYGGTPPRVELGATVLSGGSVRYWVRDNGPGLGQTDQEKLFSPFTRLDPVRANGHGVGLSIVHEMVAKMGGQTDVESNGIPGEGCTFSFTLPGLAKRIAARTD